MGSTGYYWPLHIPEIKRDLKKILIDTNAYSNYLRGDEQVLEDLSQASVVYLSVIVMGELLTGFKAGSILITFDRHFERINHLRCRIY